MKKLVILYVVSTLCVVSAVRVYYTKRHYSNRQSCGVTRIDPITKKHDEVTEVTEDDDRFVQLTASMVVDISFYSFLDIEYYPEKLCNYFNELESFDGSIETIKYISRGEFENCNKLKTIKITDSKLQWIQEDTFYDVTDLTTLNLDSNRLKYLPANLIAQNHKLDDFSAGYNKLEVIDIQFPHTLTSVRFRRNVCIDVDDIGGNVTTVNQSLENNCSATFPKIESLLETEKLNTDVRCTGRYFTFIKHTGAYMVDSEIGDVLREVYNWHDAEIVLDRM